MFGRGFAYLSDNSVLVAGERLCEVGAGLAGGDHREVLKDDEHCTKQHDISKAGEYIS